MALTTRAQAEHWRRQHLIQVPTPPPAVTPYYERPAYCYTIAALRLVVALAVLLILGTALWPGGTPTHPLRLADEQANVIGRPTAEYQP